MPPAPSLATTKPARTAAAAKPPAKPVPGSLATNSTTLILVPALHASFHRGLDSQLQEDDLRITEREQHTSVATCLLLDISHSMVLYGEDRITPAKRVAIALAELIKRKYPKDALHIILFGDVAREVSLREFTYAGVGPYHTNTEMALQLASQILSRKRHANKQIFMITDGKPTALLRGEQLHINTFGLDPEIRAATLKAAAECRRQRIPITTFMIAQDPLLMEFVEDLTQINHGRAFYADLRDLERSVFVDFCATAANAVAAGVVTNLLQAWPLQLDDGLKVAKKKTRDRFGTC